MGILFTEKLTQSRCDLMNVGLRAFVLPTGEKNSLAAYYGVGVRTVERWFAAEGQQYSRCVVPYAWQTSYPGADRPGLRIFKMYDEGNPDGMGPPTTGKLQNLRFRCILAACLGVDGGLVRIPILTGDVFSYVVQTGTLKESVAYINNVIIGKESDFMQTAWIGFEISPDFVRGQGWVVVVWYAKSGPNDDYDGGEAETDPDAGEDSADGES